MMNNVARQKLVEIIARHGRGLVEDPRRSEALLRDYCGQFRREVSALVSAVEEHAAADMLVPHTGTPREVLLARLAKRLVDHLALSEEAAKWSVESWALALGLVSSAELEAAAQTTAKQQPAAASTSTAPLAAAPQTKRAPSQTASVIVVSASGDGDFTTINEAIKVARPGAQLLVRPGIYNESITIDKPLEIVGDGPVENIIIRSVDSNCIQMLADQAGALGLTLRSRSVRSGKGFFTVDIARGQFRLEACDISSDSLSSVAIHGAAAEPIIKRCRIHDAADSGIFIFDQAAGRIEECDIYRNTNVGVAITQGAKPFIKRCRIFDGKDAGIVVWQGGEGLIEDCEVFGNSRAGVGISENGNPVVRRCNIYGGKNSGVYVHQQGKGVLEDCDIHENAEAEVAITLGSNTTLRGCTVHKGSGSGVFVRDRSRALLEKCIVYGNADAGVTIQGESAVAIRGCSINQNGTVAVRVKEGSSASVEDCDLSGNRIATWETEYGVAVERRNNREY